MPSQNPFLSHSPLVIGQWKGRLNFGLSSLAYCIWASVHFFFAYSHEHFNQKVEGGAGKMALQLRVLPALAEDPWFGSQQVHDGLQSS